MYQPQAVFRVRPVSRCTASIPGEPCESSPCRLSMHTILPPNSPHIRPGHIPNPDLPHETENDRKLLLIVHEGHAEAVLAVQFSPNGRYMASGSGDTTVRMWDLATGTPLHTLKVRPQVWLIIENLMLCHAAQPAASSKLCSRSCDADHSGAWSGQNSFQQPAGIGCVQGHKNWVLTLAWSPDAKMLASGGMDGVVWLWSPEKGEPLGTCKVPIQLSMLLMHGDMLLILKIRLLRTNCGH